jgi:hypothetical protein
MYIFPFVFADIFVAAPGPSASGRSRDQFLFVVTLGLSIHRVVCGLRRSTFLFVILIIVIILVIVSVSTAARTTQH